MLRVLVCGARTYEDRDKVWAVLRAIQSKELTQIILIEGQCPRGADKFAAEWADRYLHDDNHLKFPANWNMYKRGAGPIRNKQMLVEGKPDLVVAFGGLDGTGTNHMVRISKAAGLQVMEFDR